MAPPFRAADFKKHCATASLAPPCSGPLSVPIADVIGRVQIRHGRSGTRAAERGGIEFVLGIQHERHVEDTSHGFRLIVPLLVCQEIREVFREAEIRVLRKRRGLPVTNR